MNRILLIVIAVSTIFSFGCSKEEAGGMNSTDEKFMVSAALTDLAETDFATMALSKSETDSVLNFATAMNLDHTANLSTLRDSLARELNYKHLPTTIDTAHMSLKIKISALTGYDFDTAYINGQIRDHQSAIADYNMEIRNGYNKGIKAFAADKLPMLQMHLDRAKAVAKSLHP